MTVLDDEEGWKELTYPGINVQEDWRFACFLKVLELVHEALGSETIVTKRLILSCSIL